MRKTTILTEKQLNFAKFAQKINKIFDEILINFRIRSGAKECRSCRSRKMLQNAPTNAIVAVHTEENEPPKLWKQKFHHFNHLLTRQSDTADERVPLLVLTQLSIKY